MCLATICLLVTVQFLIQTNAFSFNLKSVGTKQVTATPGDIITYNAHMSVSDSTALTFHVSLPHYQSPIFNIEEISILGIGSNLEASIKPDHNYTKKDPANPELRSQSSLDFGNVTRSSPVNTVSVGDEVVVQVQSRLLSHGNVTSGAVFWLYYGMEYQSGSVWVIGKSVKADVQPGPAKLGAKLSDHSSSSTHFNFLVDIYHLPDSKSSATDAEISLSLPSYLTYHSSEGTPTSIAFTIETSGNIVKVLLSQLKLGETLQAKLKMNFDRSLTERGTFVKGYVYGDLQYKTTDEENCLRSSIQKEKLQMPFKLYSTKVSCDVYFAVQFTASSATLPCCYPSQGGMAVGNVGWRPWGNSSVRLANDYLQANIKKLATIGKIIIKGNGDKFVKSFFVSYSMDGVFWKYVLHLGKPKEFEGNQDGINEVFVLFRPEIKARYLRIHPQKRSPAGAALLLKAHGCKDEADNPPYQVHQRGFIATDNMLILCNVHPDRSKGKTNCFYSKNGGSRWNTIHPRVVNVIGYDSASSKMYGLGLTTADTPVYMELENPHSVHVITEQAWTAIKDAGGIDTPQVVPPEKSHARGDPLYKVPHTGVGVSGILYAASPEGLLKIENNTPRMIATWTQYKAGE